MRPAVLVVDMLKDFFGGGMTDPIGCERAASVIQPICDLTEKARMHGVPIVYVNDSFCSAEAEVDAHIRIMGRHAVIGTVGHEVVDELRPQGCDFIVDKKVYDGFYGTRLDMLLRELKVTDVIVTGIWINCCVFHTVMGAWCRRYGTILPLDCSEAKVQAGKDWAAAYMQHYYTTHLTDSKTLIQELQQL